MMPWDVPAPSLPTLLTLPPFHAQPASPKTGLHLLPRTHVPSAHYNMAATLHSPELLPPRAPVSSSFSSTTWWHVKLLAKFSPALSDPPLTPSPLPHSSGFFTCPLAHPFPSASFALTCLYPPSSQSLIHSKHTHRTWELPHTVPQTPPSAGGQVWQLRAPTP